MVVGHFPLPPSFHPSPMEFGKARNWHWRRKMFEGPNGQYGLWSLWRKSDLLFRCNGMGNDPFVDFPVWWALLALALHATPPTLHVPSWVCSPCLRLPMLLIRNPPSNSLKAEEWQTMGKFYGGNPQYCDWPSSAIHQGRKVDALPLPSLWAPRLILTPYSHLLLQSGISFVDSWRVSGRLL